jgi:hypothetical protein
VASADRSILEKNRNKHKCRKRHQDFKILNRNIDENKQLHITMRPAFQSMTSRAHNTDSEIAKFGQNVPKVSCDIVHCIVNFLMQQSR